jgi:hypothetical protein
MYYAWYDQNEWTRGETSDAPVVPYNSDDPATIEAQVREAASIGINGFELDWLGPDNPSIPSWPGGRTDRNLRKLLSIAGRYNFKATADYDVARAINAAPSDLATGLKYLRDAYTGDPAWFRFQGKPVVVFFHVAQYPVQTWQAIRNQVDPNHAMYWIGEGDNFSYLGVFDGMHAYDLHWSSNPSAQLASYARRTRQNGGKIWMATVEPGYDDHLSRTPNPPVVDRQNGAYYRAMWQGAIGTCPEIISITSWNEWVEGHYIEPSVRFGSLFVDVTRELIGKLRSTGMACAGPG